MATATAEASLTNSEREIVKTFCEALKEKGEEVKWDEAVKLVTARKFNLDRAVSLFERYKELREQLSMDSLQPLEDPFRAELATGTFTFLEPSSTEGCRIAVFTTSLFKGLETEEGKQLLFQNILFNVDECLFSSDAQRNGIILIINVRGAGARVADRHLALEILDMLQDRYPARITRVFVVDAPWWARALYGIIWPFLREKIRDRVFMISQAGLQRHISAQLLPVTLGGEQPSVHDQWIRQCSSNYVQRHRAVEEDVPPRPPPRRSASPATSRASPPITSPVPPPKPARAQEPPAPSERAPPVPPPPARQTSLRKQPVNMTAMYDEELVTLDDVRLSLTMEYIDDLQEEYLVLRQEPPRGKFFATRLPCNLPKNRYGDILALEETRVFLHQLTDESGDVVAGSDYINANFVANHASPLAYIAAQGPLPYTYIDWWRMVWEYSVRVIVMTTKLVERGRVKCDEYWPVEGGAMQYGPFTVEMLDEQLGADYCTRQFTITFDGETRPVTHYQFIAWPDFGLPATAASMLDVIALMHETNSTARTDGGQKPPIVVHCSAGVGRTGTLMATDICCQSLVLQGKCGVRGTVRGIRNQRAFAVQTPDQYKFVFMAVSEYGDSLAPSATTLAAAESDEAPPPLPPAKDMDTPAEKFAFENEVADQDEAEEVRAEAAEDVEEEAAASEPAAEAAVEIAEAEDCEYVEVPAAEEKSAGEGEDENAASENFQPFAYDNDASTAELAKETESAVAADVSETEPAVAADVSETEPAVAADVSETEPAAADVSETEPAAADVSETEPAAADVSETEPAAADVSETEPAAADVSEVVTEVDEEETTASDAPPLPPTANGSEEEVEAPADTGVAGEGEADDGAEASEDTAAADTSEVPAAAAPAAAAEAGLEEPVEESTA